MPRQILHSSRGRSRAAASALVFALAVMLASATAAADTAAAPATTVDEPLDHAAASAATEPLPTVSDYLLLPDWKHEAAPEAGGFKRAMSGTANFSYGFLNDTLSDSWSITKSPLDWRAKGWLTLGAIAGVTTGMVYLVDDRLRDATRGNEGFEKFGEAIRYLGNGPGLIALTGGFALTGVVFDRPKERETAKLLLEASAAGYLFTTAGKYTFGRSRPRTGEDPFNFQPFSGSVSMPSGETTSAFIMAGVVTSQYPQWPVQIAAYSLATAVGAGRIALDAHWSSDVFVSAALGIAVSKAVVYFNRRRAEARLNDRNRELLGGQKAGHNRKRDFSRHSFQVSPRAFRWTYVF